MELKTGGSLEKIGVKIPSQVKIYLNKECWAAGLLISEA